MSTSHKDCLPRLAESQRLHLGLTVDVVGFATMATIACTHELRWLALENAALAWLKHTIRPVQSPDGQSGSKI